MKRLCTICVRGGSKEVPGKNLRLLAGRPLIAWSIAQAKDSKLFAGIAVSSDAEDILEAARKAGADLAIRRPAALATDLAPKVPAIRHALEEAMKALGFEPEALVDLDATSPLRLPVDIVGAVRLLEQSGATSVITGTPARRSPYFNIVEERPDGTVGVVKPMPGVQRRQDAPRAFDMNASIYVWNVSRFLAHPAVFYPDTRLYVMPPERSLDIDSELDWRVVELLMAEREGERPDLR